MRPIVVRRRWAEVADAVGVGSRVIAAGVSPLIFSLHTHTHARTRKLEYEKTLC
jgi:hypothetical protein